MTKEGNSCCLHDWTAGAELAEGRRRGVVELECDLEGDIGRQLEVPMGQLGHKKH
jgi:hypothetical protein